MADNIFDAQRDRRIQNLQQQSVSNIIKQNPNLRGVLTRYEDAEVSRIKLLELQRLRNKKITKGERALLKAVAKSRGRRRGKEKKQKETKPSGTEEPQQARKSQTQIEVEAEERREKLRLEKVKLQQEREFRENQLFLQNRQEAERLANQRDIARQDREQRERFAAQRDQQRILDRQEQARLEDRRLDLQQQQIDAGVETDVVRQQTEQARIAADVERYNADVRRAEANRDRDIGIAQRQLTDLRERVARDDAFRHAQLQETQRLATEQLAAQRQENTQRVLLEQNRIDNQRAVDAERAITDREILQGFTAAVDALQRLQTPQELPTGRGLVEDVDLSSGSDVGPVAQDARRAVVEQRAESEPDVDREAVNRTLAGLDEGLREVDEDGNLTSTGQLNLEEASRESNLSSSSSSEDSVFRRLHPDTQRSISIMSGSPSPTQDPELRRKLKEQTGIDTFTGVASPSPRARSPTPERDPETGLADPSGTAQRERELRSRAAQGLEPSTNLRSQRRPDGSLRETPLAITTTASEESSGSETEFLPGQVVGAVGTGLGAVGRAAGGLVGGVAQGVFQQLPAASDVGAAVGRGGVAFATGVGSAVYQGLSGAAPEPEPEQRP